MDGLHAFLVHAESAKHFKIAVGQGTAESGLRKDGVLRGCPIELGVDLSQQTKQSMNFEILTGSS